MLFVRAVNAEGMIGQSLPLGVLGEALLLPGPAFIEVTVAEGETLSDIASAYETDREILQELNPDLGDQEPPAGTVVTVPGRPEMEEGEQTAPPSVGPSVPPAPPGSSPVPMPDVPPLKPIEAGPTIVGILVPAVVLPPFLPPAPPTGLQAQVENCTVRLRWNDNAWNEFRYDVWMAGLTGSPRLIASVQPAPGGPAWVEFDAPHRGFLSFWVEAVSFGGQQPSNISWVYIDPECATTVASQLEVDVLDMTIGGAYERAYCYVSFEGTPHVRMPADDSKFIQVQAGQGDIATGAAASRSFAVPIPTDGSLDVTGECWGWSGGAPNELGSFTSRYASDTWDGARRPLEGPSYEIGVAVQPLGATDTLVTYGYEDPTLPRPSKPREEKVGSAPSRGQDPMAWEQWFRARRLRWDWTGTQQLTGFTIFLNGTPYQSVYGAGVREALVTLPAVSDQRIRWQVAADAGEARSPLSEELAYTLPKAQAYVQVKFDRIKWVYTCDGWLCGDCSTCEAYGAVALGIGGRWDHGSGSSRWPTDVECGIWYEMSRIVIPDVLTLPFDKDSENFTVEIRVHLLDDDEGSSAPDDLAEYRIHHTFSSLAHAQSELGCGKQFHEHGHSQDGISDLYYTLTVLPCGGGEIL
jgi:hypothetical protein